MMETMAIFLGFASVFLIFVGFRSARAADPIEARLRAVQAGIRAPNAMLSQPFIQRAAAPVAGKLARLVMALLPHTWLQATEKKLVWAGISMSLPGFVIIWTALSLLLALFLFILTDALGFSGPIILIATCSGIICGALASQVWLQMKIAERHYLTRKGLPDALDMMTTSVEAGLSLDAAMVRVAEFHRGPFQDELLRALQDMSLGKSRRDALEEICDRLNVPEVITFIQTINQAEVTGAPIGRVLRVQAEQVRIGRRQAAEAQAQRAPLLMIFPLVFFIFPSIFIVLLAPAILTVIDILTNNDVFQ
jgi:tight adherence protein C